MIFVLITEAKNVFQRKNSKQFKRNVLKTTSKSSLCYQAAQSGTSQTEIVTHDREVLLA